jgi:hypothetical protein
VDSGPGSSLCDALLAASLKALTTDQPSSELMMPAAACEPLCTNQAVRTALLVIMPMLDDVDIAPVQRGEQSRDVVIPRLGGPGGAAGGHSRGGGPPVGRGGVPVGSGPVGSRSGAPASGRGGAADSSSATLTPGKGKQMCVVLDDDEVSSDKEDPLQKWLRQHSGAGPAVLDEAATTNAVADKEAADRRAVEEAAVKRAAEERDAEEATVKAAAAEEVAGKTVDEAVGAAGGSPAPGQAPSVAGAKRAAVPRGSTPLAKCPYRGVWKPRVVLLSLSLSLFSSFFSGASFSDYTFCPGLLSLARPPLQAWLLLP